MITSENLTTFRDNPKLKVLKPIDIKNLRKISNMFKKRDKRRSRKNST